MTPARLAPVLILALALPPGGRAAEPSPETLEIQQKIEQMDKLDATPANKQIKEAYQQALALLQEEAAQRAKAAGLAKQSQEHDLKIKELREAQQALGGPPPEPALAGKSLQELERAQEEEAGKKIALQNQLEEAANRLAQLQARLIPAQNELSEAKKALEPAGKEARPPAAPAGLAAALALKKRADRAAKSAQIQALELELLGIPGQIELAGLQKAVLGQRLKRLDQRLEKLQDRLRELRRAESASILDESLQLRKGADEDPALGRLAEDNVALSSQLGAYAEAGQAVAERQQAVESQAKLTAQRRSLLEQQLNLQGESGGVGELMRQTFAQLKAAGQENTQQTIGDIQKAQIQALLYERQLGEIADKAEFARATVERTPGSQLTAANAAMRERLDSLLELRRNLLGKLLERNQQLLKNQSLLLNAQNQFNDQTAQFDRLLKENLLWTRTNPAMGPAWLAALPAGIERPDPAALRDALAGQFGGAIAALAGLLLLYLAVRHGLRRYWGPRFSAWQKTANEAAGNGRLDRFRNTFYMLAGEFIAALPTPLLLLGLGRLAVPPGETEAWARQLARGLAAAALAGLALTFLRLLAKPGGFLEGQLRWPPPLLERLHGDLRLRWLPVALGAYVYAAEWRDGNALGHEFGRLPFLALSLLLALGFHRLARAMAPKNTGGDAPPWSLDELPRLLVGLFLLGEAWLAGMEVFGFHLGAVVLQARLLRTLNWMLLILLAHQIFQRWLLVEQNRLAYARALAARQAGEEEGGAEAADRPRESAVIQTISLQSKTLLQLLSATAFLASLSWIWADLIPAFQLLDQVALWQAAGEGGEPVTLKSVLLAALAAGLIALALRNLPGLLQLLVLPHLDLAPGSAFAAIALLRYLILAAGAVAVCRLLGLKWGDLQWLVAALSVGLGFGLQEIFANFICGLIILFEKPVRIGDIVTLSNGVTGTIDAINTRSTTLTDWDNKEIIIPNKILITEQLTNWSLSSLVIRVVVPVGIAYGSDTELALRLLTRAAEEHPAVLDKPEKAVFFRAFGASSLDFELRAFIADPGARVGVVHDLNMRIDRLFREHGVEIAFPQLDVHIKGGQG